MMDIRFHGNGFIQVYLNSVTRLHIWTSRLQEYERVQNARIHDHRFWFKSRVLLGKLWHKTYVVEKNNTGKHGLYQTSAHSKVAPLEKIGRCDVVQAGIESYLPGEEYEFGGPGDFHESGALRTTVTVMTKIKTDPAYHSRMVALNDEEPDHAFSDQPPEELLREEVLRILPLIVSTVHY